MAEVAQHRDAVLAQVLPPLLDASDAHPEAPSGHPPYTVVERGDSLDRWAAAAPRGSAAVVAMLEGLATVLWSLHTSGLVHGDLAPRRCVLLRQSGSWKLLDAALVADAGARGLFVWVICQYLAFAKLVRCYCVPHNRCCAPDAAQYRCPLARPHISKSAGEEALPRGTHCQID